jgi:hypothetical protein
MGTARGALLWLKYNLEPLRHCGDRLRLVIDYDRLIEQTDRQIERLAAALSPCLEGAEREQKEAGTKVAPEMRRSAVDRSLTHNAIIDQAYEGLGALATDREPDEGFWRLIADFPETEQLFESWRSDRKHALLDLATRLIIRGRYR